MFKNRDSIVIIILGLITFLYIIVIAQNNPANHTQSQSTTIEDTGIFIDPSATTSVELLTRAIEILPPHRHDIETSVTESGHGVYASSSIISFTKDTWLVGFEPVIENAPHQIIHHVMLENVDTVDSLCPNLSEKILVAGPDTAKVISFPKPFGMYIKKNTRVRVQAMMHNPDLPMGTGETYTAVSAGFKMHFAEAGNERSSNVSFYHMGVDDAPHCQSDYVFTVPPHTQKFIKNSDNAFGANQSKLTLTKAGTLMVIGSHLHGWQGGRRLDVFLNGKILYTFIPNKISASPEIWTSPDAIFMKKVSAGDTFTLSAEYENLTNEPIDGAMGMIGLYITE